MRYPTRLMLITVIAMLMISACAKKQPDEQSAPAKASEPDVAVKTAEVSEPDVAVKTAEVSEPDVAVKTAEVLEPDAAVKIAEALELDAAAKTIEASEPNVAAKTAKALELDVDAKTTEATKPAKAGEFGVDAAPLTDLLWVKGEPVEFKKGNIYIVEFWATWCPPCRSSIPHLTELQKKYKDKKVTVIGISNEGMGKVKPFVEEWGEKMEYTVAIDVNGSAEKNYSAPFKKNTIPHAFIVDANTKIAWMGYPTQIDPILDQVIAGTFDHVEYAKKQEEERLLYAKVRVTYNNYFNKIIADGPSEETKKIAAELIEFAPSNSLNSFAWDILTRVPKDKREIAVAIDAAGKANKLTFEKSPSVMDTYALALFENGDVALAVQIQQKAIDILGGEANADQGMSQRLNQYKEAVKDDTI